MISTTPIGRLLTTSYKCTLINLLQQISLLHLQEDRAENLKFKLSHLLGMPSDSWFLMSRMVVVSLMTGIVVSWTSMPTLSLMIKSFSKKSTNSVILLNTATLFLKNSILRILRIWRKLDPNCNTIAPRLKISQASNVLKPSVNTSMLKFHLRSFNLTYSLNRLCLCHLKQSPHQEYLRKLRYLRSSKNSKKSYLNSSMWMKSNDRWAHSMKAIHSVLFSIKKLIDIINYLCSSDNR